MHTWRLAEIASARGVTRADLVRRSEELGRPIRRSQIEQLWRSDWSTRTTRNLATLCEILGCTADDLWQKAPVDDEDEKYFNVEQLCDWEEEFMNKTSSILDGRDPPSALGGSYKRTTRDEFHAWCAKQGYVLATLWIPPQGEDDGK